MEKSLTMYIFLMILESLNLGIVIFLAIDIKKSLNGVLEKVKKGIEVGDEHIVRRAINGDYYFRNPLISKNGNYRTNPKGQYIPSVPRIIEEEDDNV